MKKRIVSLLLTVIMLFSLSLVSFAESKLEKAVAGDVISNITFDDYAGGQYGTTEALAYSANPAASVAEGPAGEGDKAIAFTNSGTVDGADKYTHFIVYPASGQTADSSRVVVDSDLLMYSYDVKITCPNDFTYIKEASRYKDFSFLEGKLVLLDNAGSDDWLNITPSFYINATSKVLKACINTEAENGLLKYGKTINFDTWYTVEHLYDFSEVASGKLTYKINIINKSTGTADASFAGEISGRLSAAKKVSRHDFRSWYTKGATFAFDNFKYTKMFVPSISEVKYVSSSDAETIATAKLIPASAKAVKLNIYADDINNEDISIKMDGVALGNDKYSVSCDSAADCVTITPEVGAFKANAKLEIDIADKDSVMLYVGNDKLLYVASSVSSAPAITGAVEAVNGSNTDAVITLITASYNSNTLTGVDTKPVTVTAGQKVSDTLTITPESDSNEARVFVFENMDLIKPLIGRKSVPVVSE